MMAWPQAARSACSRNILARLVRPASRQPAGSYAARYVLGPPPDVLIVSGRGRLFGRGLRVGALVLCTAQARCPLAVTRNALVAASACGT